MLFIVRTPKWHATADWGRRGLFEKSKDANPSTNPVGTVQPIYYHVFPNTMGCNQSKLQVLGIHKLQPTHLLRGSKASSFFVDHKNRLWKRRIDSNTMSSVRRELRIIRIMGLPESEYILKPLQLMRMSPTSTITCMEFASEDLFHYMRTPFDWSLMQNHLRHIRSAVHFLHNHDIAHRDIKPENIVFHHGIPKLIDFDFSSKLSPFSYCGTVNYVVDVCVVNKWKCSAALKSKRMDVYAFGKLVFSILLAASNMKMIEHRHFSLHGFFNEKFLRNPYTGKWGEWADVALQCCQRYPPAQIPFDAGVSLVI